MFYLNNVSIFYKFLDLLVLNVGFVIDKKIFGLFLYFLIKKCLVGGFVFNNIKFYDIFLNSV